MTEEIVREMAANKQAVVGKPSKADLRYEEVRMVWRGDGEGGDEERGQGRGSNEREMRLE